MAEESWPNDVEHLTMDVAFAPFKVRDVDLGRACLAGVWVHFDLLHEAHETCHGLEFAEGYYWHGIVHRREGDFAAAHDCLHEIGHLPLLARMGEQAALLLAHGPVHPILNQLAKGSVWDPRRFVAICEACVSELLPIDYACRKLQRLEWEILFDHCFNNAISG